MKLRRTACAAALITLAALSACGSNVAAGGHSQLTAADQASSPRVTPKPAPKPVVTTTAAPSPSSAITTTAPPASGGGPVIVLPIITRLPILTLADCLAYNPATLTYVDEGANGFEITDGSSAMLILDNLGDALTALTLLRNYDKQCFIGRDNPYTGNDRYRYIVDYWTGTGLSGTSVPTPDCIGYDNTALAINNLGSTGYQVVAGAQALALTATLANANATKSLAAAHHSECFIGRTNSRANRNAYIVEYWI